MCIVFLKKKKKKKITKIEGWNVETDYIRRVFLQYPRHICKHTEHRHTCLYLISRFTHRGSRENLVEGEVERRRGAILRVIGRRRSDVARGLRGIYAPRQAPQENSGGKKVGRRISIPWNLITRFIEDLWNAFRARGEVFRIRFYARLDRINYNPRVIFEFYTISNLFEIQWENLDRMFRWLLKASPWNSNVRWKNRLWYLLKNNPFTLYSREFYCYYRFIRY